MNKEKLIEVKDLHTHFFTEAGTAKAVDGISLSVRAGQTVGVVGESGSGKTTLGQALLRLVASEGPIEFEGRDIQNWNQKQIRPLR